MRLGMKRVLWGAALAAAACMFFACGEGSIDGFNGDDDMALLNYGQFNPEGMKGLVNTAMAQCEEDPQCKEAMEKAKDVPPPADSTASSSSVTGDSTSTGSSSSTTPASSPASGSSSSATPASSSAISTSSSSTAPRKDVLATKFVGTCSATSVVKGNPTKWTLNLVTFCTMEINCSLTPESYEWTFEGGDIETSTDTEPSVVYTEAKQHAAKVRLKNGNVDTTITCTPVTITGPEITGCTCGEPQLKSASNKVSNSQPTVQYEWTVSGCSSKDGKGNEETSFTYSWNGNGVSGNTETGTGSFTKMGLYSAEVKATNSDGKTMSVTCANKAPVDDASWTFKCSPMNSTERPSNNMYSQAESCHYMDINSDGRFVAENKTSNIVTFTYRDCSGNISSKQLQTSESQQGDDGGGYWNKIGERFHCTIYYYFSAAGEFGLAVW